MLRIPFGAYARHLKDPNMLRHPVYRCEYPNIAHSLLQVYFKVMAPLLDIRRDNDFFMLYSMFGNP